MSVGQIETCDTSTVEGRWENASSISRKIIRKELPSSRNQAFNLFNQPSYRRGLRYYKFLNSVASELRSVDSFIMETVSWPTERGPEDRYELIICDRAGKYRRRVFLRSGDLALLAELGVEEITAA